MLRQILTEAQEALLAEERKLLRELGDVLERLGAEDDRRGVHAASRELDTLFLVAVAGDSAAAAGLLADALLGERILTASQEDAAVRLVRRPAGEVDAVEERGVSVREAELPVLERMALLVLGSDQSAGPKSRPDWPDRSEGVDLALVLTSARRPLSGPEPDLLRSAAERASRVMVVIDEMDMLRLSEDVDRMEEAVEVGARRILGRSVPAHGVSTARIDTLPAGSASLVPALARQVEMTLRAPEIAGPKLRRPAETAREVAARRRAALDERLEELAPDRANLEAVDGELDSLEEIAEGALRSAVEEAQEALVAYGASVGSFVRGWTRPFRVAGRGRLARSFEAGPGGSVRERLEAAAESLDRALEEAGERGRSAVFEALGARPTPRLGRHPVDPSAVGATESPEDTEDRSLHELLEELHAEPTGATLIGPLAQASLLSFAMLVAGVLFAAVPFVWSLGVDGAAAGGGLPLLPVALGGGLGGAAILAAVGLLQLRRRRLVDALAERVEVRRATAAAALEALAERWTRSAAERIRAPVAEYAGEVADEVDRVETARADCARLEAGLEALLDRLG